MAETNDDTVCVEGDFILVDSNVPMDDSTQPAPNREPEEPVPKSKLNGDENEPDGASEPNGGERTAEGAAAAGATAADPAVVMSGYLLRQGNVWRMHANSRQYTDYCKT